MSLQDSLETLRRKIAEWMNRHHRLRHRRLQVVRLEDRRLPDASFALVGDVMTLQGFDGASDSLDVSFDTATDEFQFELSSGNWLTQESATLDPAVGIHGNVLTVSLPALSSLQIYGTPALKHVTDSGDAFTIHELNITGTAAITLDQANDFDQLQAEGDSLTLHDTDELELTGLDIAGDLNLSIANSLTSSADQLLHADGHSHITARTIELENTEFSTLTFQSIGDVSVVQEGDLQLLGQLSARSLNLDVDGAISNAAGTDLDVEELTVLAADSITLGDHDDDGVNFSEVTFHSSGDVFLSDNSDLPLSGSSHAGSLTIIAAGELGDEFAQSVSVDGQADLSAENITLGSSEFSAMDLEIHTDGAVRLLSGADIDGPASGQRDLLVFQHGTLNGSGAIQHDLLITGDETTLAGTLSINGALTIGAGGVLSPGNSPGIINSGNLTLANNSTLVVEIDDDNSGGHPGGVAGIDYDQISVTGTVTIGTNVILNLQDLGSTAAQFRDSYTIIANNGTTDAVTGTFAGLANGAIVTAAGGLQYRIFYNGGDGNDVVLIGRPTSLADVFVSTAFAGMAPGTFIGDVDFLTAGLQPGVYGIDAHASVAEGISAVDTNGVIHVDQGTYLHTGTLLINKSVTIDGQGMGQTRLQKVGAPTGNFDESIRITSNDVTISDTQLGWQIHNTTDYQGYVVVTSADDTTISRVLFGSNATGEGYRSAIVFEGTALNSADGLEVSDCVFEGRWGRAAIRDGDSGSGTGFLITRNEFREDHFRWGPIAIGPQDSAGTPNNFAFSGEISFNYFGNGLDTLDFQSLGNQNSTVTITNQGLTSAGLKILHNTFDWNDSTETNANGVYAQPAGVYITPTLTANTNQILIQNNIFNNFSYAGPQPGATDPLWRPAGGAFNGALEFDGADDFGVWQSPLFDVGSAGTLSFWVQMHDTTRRNQFFEGPGNAGLEMQYRTNAGGQIYGRTTTAGGDNVIRAGGDAATLLSGSPNWHNIQYTWDFHAPSGVGDGTGRMRIYVDGLESGYLANFTPNDLTWTSVVTTVNGVMNIGRDPGDPSRYFDGLMDDVGWFNTALNSADRDAVRITGVDTLASDARLIAHWDFDQTSGDIAVDNKNGILMYLSTDGVVPTEFGAVFRPGQGQFGGALEFDGIDDFATFRDSSFDVGAKGTLNFWVQMHDTTRRNQFFEGPENGGMEMQYRNNSGGQLYGRTSTNNDFVIRSGGDAAVLTTPADSWHNIQYTWDFNATNATGKMRIYVDGAESGYASGSTPADLAWAAVADTVNGLMNVGRDPGDGTRFFDGLMDDIAWYNDVLTTAELDSIRTSGVSSHADLVAHWNLDNAVGTTEATGNSGTSITLYVNEMAPAPPVSGYGVVTPAAALVLNNVFYNDVPGSYADSNQILDTSNLTGTSANPFFAGDDPNIPFTGTTLAEFYRLRWGSSAAYQSTEFQANVATAVPHIGANQQDAITFGPEDIYVAGTDFDDLVVVTFTGTDDGFFTFTRNVNGLNPDFVGTFYFSNITSFTFNGYGGDDVFIVVQPTAAQGSLFSLVRGIAFHGGLENNDGNALNSLPDAATGEDTIVLLKPAADQATLDTAAYEFIDQAAAGNSGSIRLNDSLLETLISYTGTEAVRDELQADVRSFRFASVAGLGSETILVSAPGDSVAMNSTFFGPNEIKPAVSSRILDNRIQSTLGANVSFNNSLTQLTIDAGIGNDTVSLNAMNAGFQSSLTIVGGDGADAVNLNTSLTLGDSTVSNAGRLTVTADTIQLASGVVIDTTAETAGDGDVELTAALDLTHGVGSSIRTSTGHVIETAADGLLHLGGTVHSGSGNILLQATGAGRNLQLAANVGSSSGHVTLAAANSILVAAGVDLQAASAGTISLEAYSGEISLHATSNVSSISGDIRIAANTDLTVGNVTAASANVSLISLAGAILDADANDGQTDVTALGLRMQAAFSIGALGAGSNAIETTVNTLSARAGSGGINILESNGLTVGDVAVSIQRSQTTGATLTVTDVTRSDLRTAADGSIVLRSQTGTLTLDDGAGPNDGTSVSAGGGNILIQTHAVSGDVVANASVTSGTGHITILAGDDVVLNANLTTGGTGTVYVFAGNETSDAVQGLSMQAGSSMATSGGNLRLVADNEGDLKIGLLNAGGGHVSLLAERSILDSNGVALNVLASSLRMVADAALTHASNQTGTIGHSDLTNGSADLNASAIDTQVATLAAQSAGGIYVHESNGLVVGNSASVSVQEVLPLGSTLTRTDASLSDLTTTQNGPIKLQTTLGNLLLTDGADGDLNSVVAHGSGDILLQAMADDSDILVNARIVSGTGHLTLNAGDDIQVDAALTTSGAGSILLTAGNRTQDVGVAADGIMINATITSASGDVLLESRGDVHQTAAIGAQSGDVGLVATGEIIQEDDGDIQTGTGDVLVQATGNWTMHLNTLVTAGGGEADGKSLTGDILLGRINAAHVGLTAGGSIRDANGSIRNVDGETLILRAGQGIGQSDSFNGVPSENTKAIDTEVTLLAAVASLGVYIEEASSLTIGSVASVVVNVDGIHRANFNSTTTSVAQRATTASAGGIATSSQGAVKVVTRSGGITVTANGISAHGAGDVLLEARGAGSDILVNSNVMSGTGHITVIAADAVTLNANVTTAGSGSVYVHAAAGNVTLNDADADGRGIQTAVGAIVLQSGSATNLNAIVESDSNIVIRGATDVVQNSRISAGGDLLVTAGGDIQMSGTARGEAAGGDLIYEAGETLSVGLLQATRVSLQAIAGDIVDTRADQTTNVRATELQLRAGGQVGNQDLTSAAGSNRFAIDTEVVRLAALSSTGIHVQEVAAGGSVVVGSVSAVSITVQASRSNFNSSLADVSEIQQVLGLADLSTSSDGDIRLLTLNGTIQITDGTSSSLNGANGRGLSANGAGDILLEARGAASDVIVDSMVSVATGHISVIAGDDISLNADVTTGGTGTIYFYATNGNSADSSGIRMTANSAISTSGGNVRMVADNEADILLARINAFTGSVSLIAEGSIKDSNGALQNVEAHALRMVADAAVSNSSNQAGMIGGSDTTAASTININAIDTRVDILAAQSAAGIYIREADGLTVEQTGIILTEQARFNGSTTRRLDGSLSDLTTSDNGMIKLQSVTGSVVLNDGADGNGRAVRADGTGDILIETLAASGDVIVSAQVQSGTGHITLNASDDIILRGAVSTAGTGTMILSASSGTADASVATVDGITISGLISTSGGDVLLKSEQDVRVAASITSAGGHIGLIAGRDLMQFDDGDVVAGTGDILLLADRHWTNAAGTIIQAGIGDVLGQTRTGDILLGRIDATHVALTAGRNLLDANDGLVNVVADTLSLRAGGNIGTSSDHLDTQIATLAAQSATGIFVSEADNLTVDVVNFVTVQLSSPVRVNFNSTTTLVAQTRTTQALEDLTITGHSDLQVVTRAGSLTINGGTDGVGITSQGSGSVQLDATGIASDIVLNASVRSATGSLQLTADDDLDVNALLQTGGAGDVTLRALNLTVADVDPVAGAEVDGINVDAAILTGGGDVQLISSRDIRQSAQISSDSGDVIATAARDVFQTSNGDISTSQADVLIKAGRDWTMNSGTVITSLDGSVGGVTSSGEIFLGRINARHVALDSRGGIQDINGTQLNAVSQTLSLKSGHSAGDDNSNGGSPTANADAIDTQVTNIAASVRNGIAINELDSLVVSPLASQTIGGTVFAAVSGLQTVNSDIFLNVGGDLTLHARTISGTADLRITAAGDVTQNANGSILADGLGIHQISTTRGDILLASENDVSVFSATNAFDGGDVQFHDTDDLIIRTVSGQTIGVLQFTEATGIVAAGGDIDIRAQNDLIILRSVVSSNGREDSSALSGEAITLESVDGNILIDATNSPILITSDEAAGSNAVTGDQIQLLADSDRSYNGDLDGDRIPDSADDDLDGDGVLNSVDPVIDGRIQGQVTFLGDVTLSTDGGVSKKFAKRPEVGLSATAFFVYVSNPMPLPIDNSPVTWQNVNGYLDGFFMEVGVQGEENLVVDLDWQDPADEPGVISDPAIQQGAQASGIIHSVSSERYQQFLVEVGGNRNTVGHVYTARDFTLFQQVQNRTTIVIDFSVSHHSSINVEGVSVSQANATEPVPGRDLASTDNRDTPAGLFENGIATFKIPTVTPAPPALFTGGAVARVDRPFAVAAPETRIVTSLSVTTDFGGGAVSGSAFSTEVYFQIRRQFEADGEAEVVVERITDSSLISSREAFEKFVQQTPALQDGAGYEIWLISETGGQKVERPIVEFEITGGLPGTADEEVPEGSEDLRLKDLPFEQPIAPENDIPIPNDDMSSLESSDSSDGVTIATSESHASPFFHEESISGERLSATESAEANDESGPAETGKNIEADASADLSPAISSGLAGLAVGRFRNRQRQAVQELAQQRYSRASRFSRRHS